MNEIGSVVEVFDKVAARMKIDFGEARAALRHSGQKGGANEEIVRQFLRNYLPKSLRIEKAQLIDSTGRMTRDLDVTVYDAFKTPLLFRGGDVQVVPAECAYAVIEVKACLDKNEIERIFENMMSVRALQKSAFYRDPGPIQQPYLLYGKRYDIWPIHYFVFAYESIDLGRIARLIQERHTRDRLPCDCRIDTVCSLDQGVILNQKADGTFTGLPEPGSHLNVNTTSRALLLFYTLISHYLNQARMPAFKFMQYLGLMEFD